MCSIASRASAEWRSVSSRASSGSSLTLPRDYPVAPKTRKAAIHHLLRHLDGIPDESFESIDEAVKQHGSQDMVGDYQRWFQLISKR